MNTWPSVDWAHALNLGICCTVQNKCSEVSLSCMLLHFLWYPPKKIVIPNTLSVHGIYGYFPESLSESRLGPDIKILVLHMSCAQRPFDSNLLLPDIKLHCILSIFQLHMSVSHFSITFSKTFKPCFNKLCCFVEDQLT